MAEIVAVKVTAKVSEISDTLRAGSDTNGSFADLQNLKKVSPKVSPKVSEEVSPEVSRQVAETLSAQVSAKVAGEVTAIVACLSPFPTFRQEAGTTFRFR